ncbi:hypothetical protein [Amycolatopsis sp. NPDC004079]|uniref:hypothetical protein n=1 Tax=Amycolatopsis sp. NPDC004079 TaxID=3154549 RepID=UPI0033B8CBB3
MTAATAFPAIDLSGVTERPLAETLKKDPETPTFNEILRRKRRAVSQLRNMRWPGATAEPDVPESNEPPQPDSGPEAEPDASPTPDEEPASTPEAPVRE